MVGAHNPKERAVGTVVLPAPPTLRKARVTPREGGKLFDSLVAEKGGIRSRLSSSRQGKGYPVCLLRLEFKIPLSIENTPKPLFYSPPPRPLCSDISSYTGTHMQAESRASRQLLLLKSKIPKPVKAFKEFDSDRQGAVSDTLSVAPPSPQRLIKCFLSATLPSFVMSVYLSPRSMLPPPPPVALLDFLPPTRAFTLSSVSHAASSNVNIHPIIYAPCYNEL